MVRERLKAAKAKCDYFRRHGRKYRRQHLTRRLDAAWQRHDEEAERNILLILHRERDRAEWRRRNYCMGKRMGRSVRVVQVETEDGDVTEFEGQDQVQTALWGNIHDRRFYLAEQAPICQGRLRGEFGYLARTASARSVLDGTYHFGPEFDGATRELLEECALLRQIVPSNSVNDVVTRANWKRRWRCAREKTSSSVSGQHFGHYIASTSSDMISSYHALKATIALKKGLHLDRWARGMTCILEKKPGVRLVDKLRAILLMEADFNSTNKEVFGDRMMENVRSHGLMPEEIFSEKGKTATDGSFCKTLVFDVSRQGRINLALASIDAAQCYDSIAHAIASLVFQAMGVPADSVEYMLGAIEEMKFFLRTAYGDSRNARGSKIELKFQGLCQGNGAAPAGWAVISIAIVRAHKRKGFGGTFVCPVSRRDLKLSSILFVDDTDLVHIDMETDETAHTTHNIMQQSIDNWGRLLIASGGAFKPAKCFSYLLSYSFARDGKWRYDANHTNEALDLTVPLPDGTESWIAHESVETAKETLGTWVCPSGSAKDAVKAMREKAEGWTARAQEGALPRRDVWFLMDRQFWPKVGYGLGCSTATWAEHEVCLRKQYGKILPLGGVRRTSRKELRQIDRGFFGVGCPHPGVECLVDQLNLLLMHFGCPSADGLLLQASLEYMVLELGLSFQPFQESYAKFGPWVTHSWLKTLWEKCSLLQVKVHFRQLTLRLPREGDRWLMSEFRRLGYGDKDLLRLNRVRLHQQVLFLSDVLCACGRILDRRYLSRRPRDAAWSTAKFPRESPPRQYFQLWAGALQRLTTQGGLVTRLGRFLCEGHKIWEWKLDSGASRLLHHRDGVMDVYVRGQAEGRTRGRANRWHKAEHALAPTTEGAIASVREVSEGVVSVLSSLQGPQDRTAPSCFLQVLQEWGSTWLWDSLRLVGDDDWLEGAIRDGTCVAVTDGSFIKQLVPDLCSAGFVLECSRGRGRIVGSFPEVSRNACAYRGELLGLMAIHLILLAVNKVRPDLIGRVTLYSDCLGALRSISSLPSSRIPTRCKHSDILKNVMVNCRSLTFGIDYRHVRAHQDDRLAYECLSRAAQLNCQMDHLAKSVIWGLQGRRLPPQDVFPLEPVAVFVGKNKLSSDTGAVVRYWAHKQLARSELHQLKLILTDQFDEVAWKMVHDALHEVPRLFQVWGCKQVTNIAGVNANLAKYTPDQTPLCPSCGQVEETCGHVLSCPEEGRVEALLTSITLLEQWLQAADTHPVLLDLLVGFARGRGSRSMWELTYGMGDSWRRLARSQDTIGWRRYMEGLISKEILPIQHQYLKLNSSKWSIERWAKGLVVKLMEVTHGQWLFRNVQVHDRVSGAHAVRRKEALREEIGYQLDCGGQELAEEDKYLLEINLDDLDSTSGETQEYWLLAIRAARASVRLRNRNADSATAQPPPGRA